jgi:RNA polymerase sigma-70 factor, ECF subfamily
MTRTPLAHTLAGVLSRLQGGDARPDPELAAQLDRAFDKHHASLARYVGRELRGFPAEVVEEVVQDVLLQAWQGLPSYRPDQPFRAFLWGIAARKCANVRRKKRDLLSEDGVVDPTAGDAPLIGRLADAERDELVRRAAANVLGPDDQEIVQLRWVLDYPLDDIADQLGFGSSDEVRVALQRCKRRMSKEIARMVAELGHGSSFLRTEDRS